MRSTTFTLTFVCLALGISAETWAEDELMSLCMATSDRKTCQCIASNIPPEKRLPAIVAMRRSNTAIQSGAPLDPSALSKEELEGLDVVVLAQASCM
jgi:hypothetical protein